MKTHVEDGDTDVYDVNGPLVRRMHYRVEITNTPLETRRGLGNSVRVVPGTGYEIEGRILDLAPDEWRNLIGVGLRLELPNGRVLRFTMDRDDCGRMEGCRFER